MPRPSLRSGSLRKIRTKIPGGASIIKYFKKKPKKASCSDCGRKLPGVSSKRKNDMNKLKGVNKRVSRPYGGKLCSKCARAKAKTAAIRKISKG